MTRNVPVARLGLRAARRRGGARRGGAAAPGEAARPAPGQLAASQAVRLGSASTGAPPDCQPGAVLA